jgi:alpha-ribazole phosphatase
MAELLMKIYAIRHTSVAVEPGICYGQSDVSVANSFTIEKDKIVAKLRNVEFEQIYSSPLSRCKILAENLFDKKTIVFDDRLKELNFGDWELKAWDEIYSDPNGIKWMNNHQTLPTLNGESYPKMVTRISEFLNELDFSKNKIIAIVAHAGVIRILKSITEKQNIDDLFKTFKPAYGSVTELIV